MDIFERLCNLGDRLAWWGISVFASLLWLDWVYRGSGPHEPTLLTDIPLPVPVRAPSSVISIRAFYAQQLNSGDKRVGTMVASITSAKQYDNLSNN